MRLVINTLNILVVFVVFCIVAAAQSITDNQPGHVSFAGDPWTREINTNPGRGVKPREDETQKGISENVVKLVVVKEARAFDLREYVSERSDSPTAGVSELHIPFKLRNFARVDQRYQEVSGMETKTGVAERGWDEPSDNPPPVMENFHWKDAIYQSLMMQGFQRQVRLLLPN